MFPRTISSNNLNPSGCKRTPATQLRCSMKKPERGSRTRIPVFCSGTVIQVLVLEMARRNGFQSFIPFPWMGPVAKALYENACLARTLAALRVSGRRSPVEWSNVHYSAPT